MMASNPGLTFAGYVETTVNALQLIHAAQQSVIPRIIRRLNEAERRTMIKSGSVFVFSVEESGIKRWTGGLSSSSESVQALMRSRWFIVVAVSYCWQLFGTHVLYDGVGRFLMKDAPNTRYTVRSTSEQAVVVATRNHTPWTQHLAVSRRVDIRQIRHQSLSKGQATYYKPPATRVPSN